MKSHHKQQGVSSFQTIRSTTATFGFCIFYYGKVYQPAPRVSGFSSSVKSFHSFDDLISNSVFPSLNWYGKNSFGPLSHVATILGYYGTVVP
jgi:hypothetical protein